jgi:hypothetical protein
MPNFEQTGDDFLATSFPSQYEFSLANQLPYQILAWLTLEISVLSYGEAITKYSSALYDRI